MRIIKPWHTTCVLVLLLNACKHSPDEITQPILPPGDTTKVCDSVNVTYARTIWPILAANCVSCHNSSSEDNGNIDMNKFEDIARIAVSGQLMGAIEHRTGYSAMPKVGNGLSVCDIAKIRRWIADTTFTSPPPDGIPCDPDTVYFNMDLLPILVSSCAKANCHDAISHKEGVILTDYTSVMTTADVNPFNPNNSKLYEVLTENGDDLMPPPPDAPLTADQIQMVYKWIAQGAKNLHCDNMPCDTVNVTFSGTIWPIIQDNCKGCHTGASAGGGVQLVDYGTIKAAGENGKLYGSITHASGFAAMPKNGAMLPDCYIIQVRKWIDLQYPSK
jgi:mono/diheme cytochrome c family protein